MGRRKGEARESSSSSKYYACYWLSAVDNHRRAIIWKSNQFPPSLKKKREPIILPRGDIFPRYFCFTAGTTNGERKKGRPGRKPRGKLSCFPQHRRVLVHSFIIWLPQGARSMNRARGKRRNAKAISTQRSPPLSFTAMMKSLTQAP